MNELPRSHAADHRSGPVVILATAAAGEDLSACRESLLASLSEGTSLIEVAAESSAVDDAIRQAAPADVILVSRPCLVAAGWVERLREAAHADTNIASASALVDGGTALAVSDHPTEPARFDELAGRVAGSSMRLRPRISRAVGPCVYLRREALELVGGLDQRLALRPAVELDLAQRCVLSGLTHVAADDVVVGLLGGGGTSEPTRSREPLPFPAELRERYPYLEQTPLADSAVLGQALQIVREPPPRLPATIDARPLEGTVTGTQVHILELILGLARTDALELRLLVRGARIDGQTRNLLSGVPHCELLAAELVGPSTARTPIFHRPLQTFSPGDVSLALELGERFVLSQLDLIAYRNPGYFEDAPAWEDYRAASRHGLSAAERVIVFSRHTRQELLADALVEPARIRVVPPGLDHSVTAAAVRPAALHADGGPVPYLLCLGTDFRHKNRLFALRLLRELRERHGFSGELVFAGMHVPRGSSRELEDAFLNEHPELRASVRSLGAVDEGGKAWLLEHALATVYPSVYEGFGLVPFESALAGVPCVFAPQASLAEVAPDAATIVPWEPKASAELVHELLSDGEARERHIRALAERASTLTWDATAGAIVDSYREAVAAPVREAATLSRDLVRREARLSVQSTEELERLVAEREHARRMYDSLNREVGFGLSLIGPHGSLPEGLQRALLALSARPAVGRPVLRVLSAVFLFGRALARLGRGPGGGGG